MNVYKTKQNERDALWDFLLENELVSEETLKIVTTMNGYSLNTLESVLFAVTGYRSLSQYEESLCLD